MMNGALALIAVGVKPRIKQLRLALRSWAENAKDRVTRGHKLVIVENLFQCIDNLDVFIDIGPPNADI